MLQSASGNENCASRLNSWCYYYKKYNTLIWEPPHWAMGVPRTHCLPYLSQNGYGYIRHRAFSGEACQFLFSTLLVLCTCLSLSSIGPWGPWVYGPVLGRSLP